LALPLAFLCASFVVPQRFLEECRVSSKLPGNAHFLRPIAAGVFSLVFCVLPALSFLLTEIRERLWLLLVGVVVISAVRLWLTSAALKRRIRYVIRPTDDFDPSPDDVRSFARRLTAIRRPVFGSFARPGEAIRISLSSDSDGRLLYAIEGPTRARPILRERPYGEVDVIEECPEPGDETESKRGAAIRLAAEALARRVGAELALVGRKVLRGEARRV
jgi:hypothetical protein